MIKLWLYSVTADVALPEEETRTLFDFPVRSTTILLLAVLGIMVVAAVAAVLLIRHANKKKRK